MQLDEKIFHLVSFSLFYQYNFGLTRHHCVPVEYQHATSKLFFATSWAWWVHFCFLMGLNGRSDYTWARVRLCAQYCWTFCCIK